jgi:uncharacterized membrane protein (UPF0182 family)
MSQKNKRTAIRYAIVFGVIIAVFVIFSATAEFYTDWLWFGSLGQLRTLQIRLFAPVGFWLAGGLVTGLVLAINWFLVPRRLLAQLQLRLRSKSQNFVVGPRVMGVILRVLLAFVIVVLASEMSDRWLTILTFLYGSPFGLQDPVFGLDASFYVFALPVYRFLVVWLLGLIVVALIGSALIYLLTQQIRRRAAVMHLSLLGALFLVGKAVDYQLQRFALLGSSRSTVFGVGYTDAHARLPLLHVLTGVVALGALLLIVNIFVRRWRLVVIAAGTWLLLALLGPFYASTVQRFTVQPNELALERPYIENNIRFTRYAYGLDRADGASSVEESSYPVTGTLTAMQLALNDDVLDNVRLWDWKPLGTTYEQLQEIRTYYTFAEIDIDRYVLDGQLRQVMLAVREMDIEQMREDARTWINQHLIYTHGYGLCLSPVSEVSGEGLPDFLVRDIPPQSAYPELTLTRPEIYFGERTTNYAIINTAEDEFDYPSGDENVYARYEGADGVPMGGFLRRLAFALRFDSTPIALSSAIDSQSRILFHRAIQERVRMLAPMLWYDDDPYPVIDDGRVVWLYDAYTWSSRFPYSRPELSAETPWGLNYVRNSVKVAIDAYTGETTFYVVDPSDPVIRAYWTIFPDLFTSGDAMSDTLRAHWRYPERLFRIQADAYAAYHMQDARVFYNEEDLWQTPNEVREAETAVMEPYYVIMRLPGAEATEFMMIRPYVPAGKQNMIAWLYADSDGGDYGRMGVFKFSKESLVYGPMQIEARIDQDPYISQQLTLWNQRGSSVIRGNLIVIPLDGTLLYVEPLYLQAEAGQLPELKRVLVAYGNSVAMAESLAAGLAQVLGEALETTPGTVPATAAAGDVAALARSAQTHYEAALACLQEGDWTCYGAELAALEADLQALVEATGE